MPNSVTAVVPGTRPTNRPSASAVRPNRARSHVAESATSSIQIVTVDSDRSTANTSGMRSGAGRASRRPLS